MKRILNNCFIITMENDKIIENGYIIIEDEIIIEVGNKPYSGDQSNIEDYSNKIILPSFINTHVHLMQQLGRGIADDVDLLTWLNKRIWPYESSLSNDESYLSALSCLIELLKTGVTTFLEAGGEHVVMMYNAVKRLNMNAVLTYNVVDQGDALPKSWRKERNELINIQKNLIDMYTDKDVKIALGLRTIFNCSEEMYKLTSKLQQETNSLLTTHVLEVYEEREFSLKKYNMSTVQLLNKYNLLNDNLIAAHCVYLDEEDIELFNKNNVTISYNPAAAMKVSLGFAPLEKFNMDKITIGTDGAPSNNRMDITRDMYLAALLNKGKTKDPTQFNAMQILKSVTINAAKSLKMEDKIGSISVNKQANLVVYELNDIHTIPIYNPVNNIIYSSDSRNIKEVILKGKTVVKDGQVLIIDELKVLEKVSQTSKSIKEKIFT